MSARRLRLGVLVSGGGRTLTYLDSAAKNGELAGDVVCCIASGAKCAALDRAAAAGIPAVVIRPRDHADPAAFAAAIFAALDAHAVDVALLAGYLVKLPIVPAWRGRVLNIHPALLPAFGGRGFYGHHVHEAVRAAGVKVTGCTVHFVDDEYDHGPIVVQRAVPVRFEDDADEIAARVFDAERGAYLEAINLLAADRLRIRNGRVEITP
jgi:phosphoribosylglycinamide formyltransferase 1